MHTLAVITGDIVDSKEISPLSRQSLYKDLDLVFKELKQKHWIDNYEMYRGDSFQCVMTQKFISLKVAIYLRAFIKAYIVEEDKLPVSKNLKDVPSPTKGYYPGNQDIRLSIGIGKVDFYNEKSLAHSDGPAFWFSGQGLDHLKKAPYRMSIKTEEDKLNESLEPSILLLDAVLQKWTNNQAEIIKYKLQDYKEEEASRELKISQSAVNQRIKTSQWFAIEKLLQYFEKTIKAAQ